MKQKINFLQRQFLIKLSNQQVKFGWIITILYNFPNIRDVTENVETSCEDTEKSYRRTDTHIYIYLNWWKTNFSEIMNFLTITLH